MRTYILKCRGCEDEDHQHVRGDPSQHSVRPAISVVVGLLGGGITVLFLFSWFVS
jgi:hypothetical protein